MRSDRRPEQPRASQFEATSPTPLPSWVLLSEAALLTGRSEQDLQVLIQAGRIKTSPLGKRRSNSRVVLLRTSDLQDLGSIHFPVMETPPRPDADNVRTAEAPAQSSAPVV